VLVIRAVREMQRKDRRNTRKLVGMIKAADLFLCQRKAENKIGKKQDSEI